jgi:hypothetical protein
VSDLAAYLGQRLEPYGPTPVLERAVKLGAEVAVEIAEIRERAGLAA